MALIDCSRDSKGECGELNIMANFGDRNLRIDVQYPGNANVWYAIGSLAPHSKFESGASNILLPGDSLIRAATSGEEEGDSTQKYYLVGRIQQATKNVFYVPELAFK